VCTLPYAAKRLPARGCDRTRPTSYTANRGTVIDKVLPVFHQSASMPGVLQHAAPQLNHEFPGAPATPRLPQARQDRLFEPTQEGIGPGIAGFITPPDGVNIESGQSVDAVSNFSA
jgi:hypothetical protein